MNNFTSHFSAAKYWDECYGIPYLDNILEHNNISKDVIDITVSSKSDIHRYKGFKYHLCTHKLPRDAVIRQDDKLIASPELVFLQLANKINFQSLILLGIQMCSNSDVHSYSRITSKKKLLSFIRRTTGFTGQTNARRAIKYVEENSLSIMESLTYMILTLPNALGGYGLSGAIFNHPIPLDDESSKRLNQYQCYVDLYYEAEKVAIEYDSFSFHSTPKQQGRDRIRSEILKRQGIDVLHLSTIQLYDPVACNDFARSLSKCLGRRISIRTDKYEEMKLKLRALLPVR